MFSSLCEDQRFVHIYYHKLYEVSLRRSKGILHKMLKDAYVNLQISHIKSQNLKFSLP